MSNAQFEKTHILQQFLEEGEFYTVVSHREVRPLGFCMF